MHKHYSVTTFVHINLPEKPIFSINKCNLALNIVIKVVSGAYSVKKRSFNLYLYKIVNIQQLKKPDTRTKVDFFFERATFCLKSQLLILAQN